MYNGSSQLVAILFDGKGKPIKDIEVIFNINGVFYNTVSDLNGISQLNIDLQPGEYIVTVYNNITGQNMSSYIVILPTIICDNLTKHYKNDSQYYVTVLEDINKNAGAGLKVVLNINGVSYEKITDENGIVKLDINLSPGIYTITIIYGNLTQLNTVTVLSTIISENIEMPNTNRKPFSVMVLNDNGIPKEKTHIKFNINGIFYDETTDEDGLVSLNIDLMVGTYIITSILDNGLMQSNTITIKD